jgi:hypothetical protein
MELSRRGDLGEIAELGLTLSEAKRLLVRVQQEIVATQARDHAVLHPECPSCGGGCHVKDWRHRAVATLFGAVAVRLPRFRCIRCGHNATSVGWPSHCRSTPELDQLRAHLSALMPLRVAADVLSHLLPLAAGMSPETLRGHTLKIGERLRAAPAVNQAVAASSITVTTRSDRPSLLSLTGHPSCRAIGLAPFVEARMTKVHGPSWLRYASRASGARPDDALDAYGLLKTMIDSWREVFDEAFGRNEKHRARNFVSVALDARNAVSHLALALADDEALRYLDAMHHLLRLAKAPEGEVAELRRLYEEQRRGGVAPEPTPKPAAAPAPARLDVSTEGRPAKALQPWIEVALPHPDVIANRFKEAEFAADLFAVDAGLASDGYATPMAFFGITFLTEGLKRVLSSALQRLCGAGGDPVIGLQTAFGGGKTHTMLAIYHLAKHLREGGDPRSPAGVAPLMEGLGDIKLPKPGIAVFVGSSKGTDVSLTLKDGPPVHTLWGYIAWRLAGDAGLKLLAAAEAARTNPGSELLVELFRLSGPSVILLDEVVAFAGQLPDDRFEALLSFVQSLTEAAKMVPGILVVGSLPESAAEAGGEKGVQALRRLQAVFGRVQRRLSLCRYS